MIIDVLKDIVTEKNREGVDRAVVINFLKEYLQYPAYS